MKNIILTKIKMKNTILITLLITLIIAITSVSKN